MQPVPEDLLDLVRELLPGVRAADARLVDTGESHRVVLLPDVAAIRIARTPGTAAALPRRVALLSRLQSLDLPFVTPVPLTDVVEINGCTAVAVSWVPGSPTRRGVGEPAALARLLDELAAVDLGKVSDLLGAPRCYAGGTRWEQIMRHEVVPRLPAELRPEASRRIDAVLAMPAVRPTLVHGDLAGHNVHWTPGGTRCVGVLDWDLAQPYDPAVDAAGLAWHGWHTLRRAVAPETYARARRHHLCGGLEQIASALLLGQPPEARDAAVARTARWMERTMADPPPA